MNCIWGLIGASTSAGAELGKLLVHRGTSQNFYKLDELVSFGVGTNKREKCYFSDGRFCLVCDAVIYNRDELKKILAKRAIPLLSELSSELLLKLVYFAGIESLSKVNGDFVFAAWDKEKKQLALGRDYCGCKPLYYSPLATNCGIAFASEYKALLELPGVNPTCDRDMIQCLQYQKKLPIGCTLLKGINSVLPGSIEIFDSSGNKVDCVRMRLSIEPKVNLCNEERAMKKLRQALSEAVKCRVDNPQKIGISLSGGIDSIGIAFICRAQFPDAEIHTFAAGANHDDDELKTAAKVSCSINAIHHPVYTPPALLKDHLEKLVWHLEDPVARSESLQLLKIGQAANGHVDSLLCGMEADALFAGMARHKILRWISKWPIFKQPLSEIYDLTQKGLAPRNLLGMVFERAFFRKKFAPIPKVIGSNYLPPRTDFPKTKTQFVNTFLAQSFQSGAALDGPKLERTFAASGVRYCSPFLDPNLIQVAFSIPEELKFKDGGNKYILRKALGAWVPEEFLYIPKKPQRMKYDLEFSAVLDDVVDCYMNKASSADYQLFEPDSVDEIKKLKCNDIYPAEVAMRLWTAVLTVIWYELFGKSRDTLMGIISETLL